MTQPAPQSSEDIIRESLRRELQRKTEAESTAYKNTSTLILRAVDHGISVREISTITGIPRSIVEHRARVLNAARGEADREFYED